MFNKKSASFTTDKSGKWVASEIPPGTNPDYLASFVKTLNEIEPIFQKAKNTSEFDLILSLLSVRSVQDAGWDTYETIRDIKKSFLEAHKKLQYEGDSAGHFTLYQYGLILEASEYYEKLATVLEVADGQPFRANVVTFTKDKNGKIIHLKPIDKIAKLKSLAKKVNLPLTVFDDFYDNHLRNAAFHCDFTFYNHEVRTLNPDRIYSYAEVLTLFNGAWGYSDAFDFIIDNYRASYTKPVKIPVPSYFGSSGEKAQLIIRKGRGVIGLKDAFSKKELSQGKIDWRLSRPLSYEVKLIDSGVYLLPEDRFEKINKIIRLFPKRFRPFLVEKISSSNRIKQYLAHR